VQTLTDRSVVEGLVVLPHAENVWRHSDVRGSLGIGHYAMRIQSGTPVTDS